MAMACVSTVRHVLRATFFRPKIINRCGLNVSNNRLNVSNNRLNVFNHRAFSTATNTADVIIIGAGVIGNSIATELSRKGMRTLSVEKQVDICHAMHFASQNTIKFPCALIPMCTPTRTVC